MLSHYIFTPLQKLKLPLSCLMLTVLIGCGFTLRGNIEIPIEAQSVWLEFTDKSSSELKRSFNTLAKQNNLTVDEFADYHIVVNRVNFNRITTTIDSDAEVDEYTLRGELTFDIVSRDGEIVTSGLEGFSERTFEYDANDASASNSREAFLNREVWQNLATQILRQYSAFFRLR